MSMENAILELAAAIRYAADKTAGGTGNIAKLIENVSSNGPVTAKDIDAAVAKLSGADTIEADVTKVETDAKADQKKVMAQVEADRKPSAAKEAITKALYAAKAEKAAAPAPVVEEDDPLADSTPLDYEKDVKPKLVSVGKNKQEMVDLLASFGVGKDLTYAKADQLPADKFGAVVAACDKILASRG